jgi:hypothetical protein
VTKRRVSSIGNSVFAVFTPTMPARVNFVPRDSVNDALVDALQTPGKQVVLYGESGSGKSTLVQKKLEELYEAHITTRCNAASTFDGIVLDAFDQLNQYFVESNKSTASRHFKASLQQDLVGLKVALEAQRASVAEVTTKRVVAPQLTVPRLATGLGMERMCWVIEDFHKVPEKEKTALSQAFKIFSDVAFEYPAVKIVAIGAADSAREVVQHNPEMRHRVAELYVPLMTHAELRAIIAKGEELMNVRISNPGDVIPRFSSGLASVCHHLCLNICLAGGVEVTAPERVVLAEKELRMAVARYVQESADTVKAAFEHALRRHGARRYDNARLIIRGLAGAPLEGLPKMQILEAIQATQADYPSGNLTRHLRDLAADPESILKQCPDGRYRFSDPIYHVYAQGIFWPDRPVITGSAELRPFYSVLFESAKGNIGRWTHIRRG